METFGYILFGIGLGMVAKGLNDWLMFLAFFITIVGLNLIVEGKAAKIKEELEERVTEMSH